MKDERTESTRYPIQDDELQIFSHDIKIASRLKDISKGGLAFQYTPVAGEKLETNSISIMAKGMVQFYLFDIACRKIYDIPSLEDGQSFTGAESRQRGIKFIGLTENQQNKLELLLKNFAVKSSDNSWTVTNKQ